MKAGLRDSSFYARPAHDTGKAKYHAIVDRGALKGKGPACGYPLHDESTEEPADRVDVFMRCGRPGCRSAFATLGVSSCTEQSEFE
jgi:hypothetical protein